MNGMNMNQLVRRMGKGSALVAAVFLVACTETTPVKKADVPAPTPAPTVSFVQKSADQLAAEAALNDGMELYLKGDYNGAIKRFGSVGDGGLVEKSTQIELLKHMAFSYCVTHRQTQCRHAFEKILKVDPTFDLTPGEKGHPLWGPVFTKVKKAGK